MERKSIFGFRIVIITIIGCVQCSEIYSTKEYKRTQSSALSTAAFRSDIAFAFFKEAQQYSENNSTRAFSKKQCLKDIAKIQEGIQDLQEWALEWPDSWGRMPMGLFWGHTISMGAYEECLAASQQISETHSVRGKYCLANIPIKEYYSQVKPRNNNLNARTTYKQSDPTVFQLGICIPSSCSAKMGNDFLREVLKNVTGDEFTKQNMVREKMCRIEEPIVLRGIDIFAIAFLCTVVFIMIVSSIYDAVLLKKGQNGHPLLTAFSVYSNAPKIFTVKPTNNPNVISCLAGMRTISMMWVVFGHGYMTFKQLPHVDVNKFYTWIETPYSMLVQNATFCVDTFFFMSGLLMLWGVFREMEKNKGRINIPLMYFHRYIRLTPVLAVLILYILSLYKYSGHGPMWMKIAYQDKRCSETWWATLLYVQNYMFPHDYCVGQSWYLAVDTQLYVLSPLILIPLWKWGKKALGPIILLGVLCMVCTYATFMKNGFTLFRVQDDDVDRRQALTYYPTHTRVPTWLIGVLFGYFFFKYNRGRQFAMNKWLVILGWTVALGTMLACVWGPYWRILPGTPNAPIVEGALYEPISRASWACAIGWIVWACYNGHGGIINDFLSWGFFQGFARLSYCMYIIHRVVQNVNGARIQHDTKFGDYEALLRWWHDFGISLTLSCFATLAFEAPILGIEKAIFRRGKPSEPKKPKELLQVSVDGTKAESLQSKDEKS
ncbi:nose resistant to fluoxetine protein 6-like [Episyrphus balteatus]|uniref:nose resistant to fluoxetine protein 6-like n=1 Tax=Episyrphus balteatus TaxID=286459 RepID=UPI002486091F|nr:nose resistant to fluoxetine protein 6-like [Episyrphus balteatus]